MVATKRLKALCFLLFFLWSSTGCSPIHSNPDQHEQTPLVNAVSSIFSTATETQASSDPPPPSSQKARSVSLPEIKYLTHKIKWSGENLGRIALWYTGASKNWKLLIEANPGIQPLTLRIGDSVLIPENLLIRHNSMPTDFLSNETEKKKDSSSSSVQQVVDSDKVEFFGPVDTTPQAE